MVLYHKPAIAMLVASIFARDVRSLMVRPRIPLSTHPSRLPYSRSAFPLHAKPKRGSIVDSYQTVSVNCNKCRERLFRYKKKNGTKSNLVKMYVERISEDFTGLLPEESDDIEQVEWCCPNCQTNFARPALIHGRPALKLIGGKIRMTKK